MNKYQSGYALVSLISIISWFVIVGSLVSGGVIVKNAPVGSEYVGFMVAIIGAIQGVMMLGVGAIGQAILDGSIAQQEIARCAVVGDNASSVVSGGEFHHTEKDMIRYLVAASMGVPGGEFLENYAGNLLIRDISGNINLSGKSFTSLGEVRSFIDSETREMVNSGEFNLDADGALNYMGYKIPCIDGRYLLNGQEFASVDEVIKYIEDEVKFGGYKIRNYKILR